MTYDRLARLTDRQIDDLASLDDENRLVPPPAPPEPERPRAPKTPQERMNDWTSTCMLFGIPLNQARAKFAREYGRPPEEMGVTVHGEVTPGK